MDFAPFQEIDALDTTDTQLHVKQEPQNEFLDTFIVDPVLSVMISDSSSHRIKDELETEEEIIERPCKKRRKLEKIKKSSSENAPRNGTKKDGTNGKLELTQLPCIISIKPSADSERSYQGNHNGTLDTSNGSSNDSLQFSISERIYETDDHVTLIEAEGQNSSNNIFTSKVYEILVDIQSTLKDLKEQVAENSKKIDELQKFLPQPWSWKNAKSDFNFPISTEEQLLEFEKQLENNEMATKLVVHLTTRTYASWKEMILLCMKYMLSRNVAVLYNLNGRKGTKKKFRDFNICNILVECVQFKFKEATTEEILKRISLTLAGAGDWQGSRKKKD